MAVSDLLDNVCHQMLMDRLDENVADELSARILFEATYFSEEEEVLIVKYFDWAMAKKGWN